MDVNDLKSLNAEVKKRMTGGHRAPAARTGRRAHRAGRPPGILDPVHVDAYGTRMPLNQVATLSVPEPTLIVAQPFDPSLMGAIEKAIRASDLGLNPNNDGKVDPHPRAAAHRRAPQGAVAPRAQDGRGERATPSASSAATPTTG